MGRFYNYLVYSLLDIDTDGYVTADEVYTHFFTYVADDVVVSATATLLDTIGPSDAEKVLPGPHFVRLMQSGALRSAMNSNSVDASSLSRPQSAPSRPSRRVAPPVNR